MLNLGEFKVGNLQHPLWVANTLDSANCSGNDMTVHTEYCQPWKLTEPWYPEFLMGFGLYRHGRLLMWLTLVSSSYEGQADTTWPKAPTIDHIVSIDSLVWPKASGKQTLQSGRTFQGPRDYRPGAEG